ncbi:MAG: pilus assembly protein [Microbacterium sp.]
MRWTASAASERGSSTVEFALVGALLTMLTLAILQLGLVVYVRNVVHDAAVAGAYQAALVDQGPDAGAQRTRLAITQAVGAGYANDVSVQYTDGGARVVVTVRAALPVLGLIGVPGSLEVSAGAPTEIVE